MSPQTKTLLVLLSVTLNVTFVVGWGIRAMRTSPVGGSPAGVAPLHQQLDLTPAQLLQIEPLLQDFRNSSAATMRDVEKRRSELLDLLAAPQPDRVRIEETQRAIQAGQRQCQTLVVGHIMAEAQILTPEQRQKYFDLLRQSPAGQAHGGMGRWLQGTQNQAPPADQRK